MTNEFGVYGMCIDDLVFHFVFGYHPHSINDAAKSLGPEYLALEEKIKNEGLTEENIAWLLDNLKQHNSYTTRIYSKSTNTKSQDTKAKTMNKDNIIFKRIEELKAAKL